MNEIKFRAWDKVHNEMWVWEDGDEGRSDKFNIAEWIAINPASTIFMQYTGFKDKGVKEIYEGDILRDGEDIFEVVWIEFGGYWGVKHNGEPSVMSLYKVLSSGMWADLKIIGNIYEKRRNLKTCN